MTLSTAGTPIRITGQGAGRLPLLCSHRPGWRLVSALAHLNGLTTDACGLWAQIGLHGAPRRAARDDA
jgi:hypothetical protein